MIKARRLLEPVLWLLTLAAMGRLALVATSVPAVPPAADEPPVPLPQSVAAELSVDSLIAWSDRVVQRDPFRLSRRPPAVAFGTEVSAPSPYETQSSPNPQLVLRGIVGSVSGWKAVLGGVPGREESVVVRTGDTLGDLRVRRVGRDTVVVQGTDTTWRLTLRQEWR